jgi:hypothetical protein
MVAYIFATDQFLKKTSAQQSGIISVFLEDEL